MGKKLKISVGITVKNDKRVLETLDGVMNQTRMQTRSSLWMDVLRMEQRN